MPMLDVRIPAGALSSEIEEGLVERLTDLLRGLIIRLADIAGLVLESAAKGSAYARSVLADRR